MFPRVDGIEPLNWLLSIALNISVKLKKKKKLQKWIKKGKVFYLQVIHKTHVSQGRGNGATQLIIRKKS